MEIIRLQISRLTKITKIIRNNKAYKMVLILEKIKEDFLEALQDYHKVFWEVTKIIIFKVKIMDFNKSNKETNKILGIQIKNQVDFKEVIIGK